jgi:hypothetical protein
MDYDDAQEVEEEEGQEECDVAVEADRTAAAVKEDFSFACSECACGFC